MSKVRHLEKVLPANWLKSAGLFLLIVFGLYFNAYSAGFIGDDTAMILDNQANYAQVSIIKSYFSEGVWNHSNLGWDDQSIYRPIWLIWEFLNYQLFGEDPLGWHISNLLLHALNGFLLFLVITAIFPATSNAIKTSFVVLFLVHPITSHNVMWVSGSTDLLLSVFSLATILFYRQFATTKRSRWLVLSLVCLILAILTKETGLLLIPVFLLMGFIFDIKAKDSLVQYSLIFLVLCGYFFVRNQALAQLSGEDHSWVFNGDSIVRFVEYSLVYFRSFAIPWPLPITMRHSSEIFNFWLDVLVGLAVMAVIVYLFITKKEARIGISLMVFPMAIPLLLAFNELGLFAVRFLYLPLIGAVLFLIPMVNRVEKKLTWPLFLVPMLMLSAITVSETYKWKNAEQWTYNLIDYDEKNPGHWYEAAQQQINNGQFQTAVKTMRTGMERVQSPESKADLLESLAVFYAEAGKPAQSVHVFNELLQIEGFEAEAWTGLGNSYWMLNRLSDATSSYQKAIDAKPDYLIALYNLGLLFKNLKRNDQAIELFERIASFEASPEATKYIKLANQNLQQLR